MLRDYVFLTSRGIAYSIQSFTVALYVGLGLAKAN